MPMSTKSVSPSQRKASLLGTALLSLIAGCAPLHKPLPGTEAIPPSAYGPVNVTLEQMQAARLAASPQLPPRERVPSFDAEQDEGGGQPALYSFKAHDIPLRDALGLLARAHDLNIVADPDISGQVSVDFQNVPLSRAFDILLSSLGYTWVEEKGVIRVLARQTRTFEVDYIKGGRSSSSASGANAAVNDAGAFWQELESQIRSLLSPSGKLTINRLTGAIMVTDLPARVGDVDRYITLLRDGMYRQIDIEVRIVEVTLRDQFALGLDWSRLRSSGSLRFNTTITSPQGLSPSASTMILSHAGDKYLGLIEALGEQGDVRVVSQPRLRILNNQTAFVKVGTERTFFMRSSNRVIQGGGNVLETVNEQPRSVNVGVSLTVTPQISADGWAMLNVTPSVTRLMGTDESRSQESSAPVLDVSEANTMVRVRSGDLVLMGGLIQEETSESERKVPGLGDLPVLGQAFKSNHQGSQRKELVIFLAPTLQPGQ